jgi:DNA-binding TFAR19-related protein (PDSD5 family)
VKPEKAASVERALIQMAQNRQLGGKVGENQLIEMLEGAPGDQKETKSKIVIQHKRFDESSSSDEYSWDD